MSRFILVILLAFLLACAGDDSIQTHEYRVEGRFSRGDAMLEYVATFVDSTLVKVEEEQTFGETGRAEAVYHVHDGRLVSYRLEEERERVTTDEADPERVRLELEFDLAGRLIEATKLVDGEPTELLGYEAPGAQRHFVELRGRVEHAGATARAGMR